MVEPIASEERFGIAEVKGPVAPKHTKPEHEMCAYYVTSSNDPNIMVCSHEQIANGAFYSEDYLNEFRAVSHRVLGWILEHPQVKASIGPKIIDRFMELSK